MGGLPGAETGAKGGVLAPRHTISPPDRAFAPVSAGARARPRGHRRRGRRASRCRMRSPTPISPGGHPSDRAACPETQQSTGWSHREATFCPQTQHSSGGAGPGRRLDAPPFAPKHSIWPRSRWRSRRLAALPGPRIPSRYGDLPQNTGLLPAGRPRWSRTCLKTQ